ncbi:hypothetical protein S40293_01225 [Stachybotrys chartarum IBT 40293]|nr:hypothetical protein S40293_01225 [Stachybotrys chartarum IBT 40293]
MDDKSISKHHSNCLPPKTVDRFIQFVNSHSIDGFNGHWKTAKYMTRKELLTYWDDHDDPREILHHFNLEYLTETVRENYLQVFSTLVYIDKVPIIEFFARDNLKDDYWPRETAPLDWYKYVRRQFWDDFRAQQWIFFPFSLSSEMDFGRRLPMKCVLPIAERSDLAIHGKPMVKSQDPDAAEIFKVRMNEGYDGVGSESCNRTFIFKAFSKKSPALRDSHSREVNSYERLQSSGPSDYTAILYASFEQNETLYLVLEFVDGPNLQEYLEKQNHPQSREDVYKFWTSSLGIVRAFINIHQVTQPHKQSTPRALIYSDLKPDNVMIKISSTSQYDFRVKLVDFGHSAVVSADGGSGNLQGPDHYGNGTFQPIEGTHHDPDLFEDSAVLDRAADVWGIGCIMILLACWVVDGTPLMKTSDQWRREELWCRPKFRKSPHMNGYHNGNERLGAVGQAIALMRNVLAVNPDHDRITPAILDIIDKHAVTEREQRMEAKQLLNRIEKVLDELRPGLAEEKSSRSLDDHRTSPKFKEASSSTNEPLTLVKMADYMEGNEQVKETESQFYHTIAALRADSAPQPRDHIILIENSVATRQHRKTLCRILPALLKVAEHLDPDGVEVAFTSNPKDLYRKRDFMKLEREQQYNHSTTRIESLIETFLDEAVMPRLRALGQRRSSNFSTFARKIMRFSQNPLTIIILTTGAWGGVREGAAGVETPISRLIKRMKKDDVGRTKIALQFLQLDNNETGKRYLKYLDEMGRKEGYDIVDTKCIYDTVEQIFTGAIAEAVDQQEPDRNGWGGC